jgi:serine kinase of HPr protein (carbohydrate metabolism regulator)
VLVADDQVLLERSGDRILARSPLAIAGKLEVRGVGIVDLPNTPQAELDVLVELTDPTKIERLPEPGAKVLILGLELPVIRVAPFQASAPIKVLLSLVANVRPV